MMKITYVKNGCEDYIWFGNETPDDQKLIRISDIVEHLGYITKIELDAE